MADKNLEYWRKREQLNIEREVLTDHERVEGIRRIIQTAQMEVLKDINDFYTKYADNEGISIQESKKRVSDFDVTQYENMIQRYMRQNNLSEHAKNLLKLYNTKMKVSRQELLMMQLRAHLVAMADEQINKFHEYLSATVYAEVARQASILGINLVIAPQTVQAIVETSFYGADWKTRINGDMKDLESELNHVINSSLISGKHPYKYSKRIRERFDVSAYEARRLLITETARVQVEAQRRTYESFRDALEEEGIPLQYEYVAKLDERTTKTCKGLDGRIEKVENMVKGKNAPPMHPFCRSSTMLVTGNWREDFFKEREGKYTVS